MSKKNNGLAPFLKSDKIISLLPNLIKLSPFTKFDKIINLLVQVKFPDIREKKARKQKTLLFLYTTEP